ncbi:hypothetical protein [Parapedobacter sp. DT-150]|uniref:hypothetical protein n=1 Tax=Parapedobacter sp. DT-150 TaxID=3396162 RepID=UPI003F1E3450
MTPKIILFEYFLKRLMEWFCEYHNTSINEFNNHLSNDLSKLKVVKLHFFACSTSHEALEIFDDFRAMPYGHVESEVYNALSTLEHFDVTNFKLLIRPGSNLNDIQHEQSFVMDEIVNNLKTQNFDLISLPPFDLVELSHRWFSWRYTFEQARNSGFYSKPISKELIQQETKLYSLY